MFNLEQAIAGWRYQMNADGLKSSKVLDELESHLREEIERRSQSGEDVKLAFCAAVERLGPPQALKTEFAKVGETNAVFARIKDFLLTLIGVQNPSLATNMNTSSNGNMEPAWATYVKFGAFVLPATILWLFVAVFVFPKFNEVVMQTSQNWMPGLLRAGWNFALLLRHYLLIVSGAFVVALALLEWRSSKWPQYRRAAFGIGTFALNSVVLIAITAMVVLALCVAPDLAHHMK